VYGNIATSILTVQTIGAVATIPELATRPEMQLVRIAYITKTSHHRQDLTDPQSTTQTPPALYGQTGISMDKSECRPCPREIATGQEQALRMPVDRIRLDEAYVAGTPLFSIMEHNGMPLIATEEPSPRRIVSLQPPRDLSPSRRSGIGSKSIQHRMCFSLDENALHQLHRPGTSQATSAG